MPQAHRGLFTTLINFAQDLHRCSSRHDQVVMAGTVDEPPTKPPDEPKGNTLKTPNLDDVIKALTISSIILYGILFLGYRAYYVRLGLTPEDVGVSASYILVRSTGFILLVLASSTITIAEFYLMVQLDDSWGPEWRNRQMVTWLTYITTLLLASGYVFVLFPNLSYRNLPWATLCLAAIAGPAFLAFCPRPLRDPGTKVKILAAGILATALVAVIVPTIVISQRAEALAEEVLAGNNITPYQLFGGSYSRGAARPA